jgi:RraA family protein
MPNVGFRVYTKIGRPDKELVEQFKGLPVSNIGDEMNRICCVDARIKSVNTRPLPLLGTAFTVKARIGDNLMLHAAIDMAQPGDVVVVDGQGDLVNSLIGENMMLWAERRGLAGMIVDGAVRDIQTLREMNFPVYAAGVQPNGPYKDGPGEINVPVCCGGITVHPGDIIVGDPDGIVVIRPKDAPVLLEKAKAKLKQELATREAIAKGIWDRSKYTAVALQKLGCEIIDDYYQ